MKVIETFKYVLDALRDVGDTDDVVLEKHFSATAPITSGVSDHDILLGLAIQHIKVDSDFLPFWGSMQVDDKLCTFDQQLILRRDAPTEMINRAYQWHKIPVDSFMSDGLSDNEFVEQLAAHLNLAIMYRDTHEPLNVTLCYNWNFLQRFLTSFIENCGASLFRSSRMSSFLDITSLVTALRSGMAIDLRKGRFDLNNLIAEINKFPSRSFDKCLKEYGINPEVPAGEIPASYKASCAQQLWSKLCAEELPILTD